MVSKRTLAGGERVAVGVGELVGVGLTVEVGPGLAVRTGVMEGGIGDAVRVVVGRTKVAVGDGVGAGIGLSFNLATVGDGSTGVSVVAVQAFMPRAAAMRNMATFRVIVPLLQPGELLYHMSHRKHPAFIVSASLCKSWSILHCVISNMTGHQLKRLTSSISHRHVHKVGNLLPGSPMDLLGQIYQINRDWRRHLSISSTDSGWRLVQREGFLIPASAAILGSESGDHEGGLQWRRISYFSITPTKGLRT